MNLGRFHYSSAFQLDDTKERGGKGRVRGRDLLTDRQSASKGQKEKRGPESRNSN